MRSNPLEMLDSSGTVEDLRIADSDPPASPPPEVRGVVDIGDVGDVGDVGANGRSPVSRIDSKPKRWTKLN